MVNPYFKKDYPMGTSDPDPEPDRKVQVVSVTLTIDGVKETVVVGECPFMEGKAADTLEKKGIGIWLQHYRFADHNGKPYRGRRVFCPWNSILYMEEIDGSKI